MSFGWRKKERLTSQARGTRAKADIEIDGRTLRLTNLDRVLYPETGFTKGDLIDYYAAVAPLMLPHLKDRPLSMRRFPEGVEADGFWEKQCPDHRPGWVKTAAIKSESSDRGVVDYCLVNDLSTLVWIANLGCIEFHLSLARATRRKTPDFMVFDLDPGEPADVLDCAEIALLIHDTLKGQGLESLAKVSGSKGLQIYVPLHYRVNYDRTGGFAHALARAFESEMPDRVVSKMRKSLRKGKILIDWSQNSRHKTTVAVYSLRARPEPSVSTPVSWETVARACEKEDSSLLHFTPRQVLRKLDGTGDPFADVLSRRQKLPG